MEKFISAKYDNFRKSLMKENALKLHEVLGSYVNPFHACKDISFKQADKLFNFISPPLSYKKNKAHYLIFIADVLERLELIFHLISAKTNLEKNGELHKDLKSFEDSVSNLCKFFKKLSLTYPCLYTVTFISSIKEKFQDIENSAIEEQIIRSLHGIISDNPVYISFFEPYILNHNPEEKLFLNNYALISGAIWNVRLWRPDRLHSVSSLSIEIRRMLTFSQILKKNILEKTNTTQDFIEAIRRYPDLNRIRRYLEKLYVNNAGLSKGSANNGNSSNSPRPHFHYVEIREEFIVENVEIDIESISASLINELKELDNSDDTGDPQKLIQDLSIGEKIDKQYIYVPGSDGNNFERQALNLTNAINSIEKNNQFFIENISKKEFNHVVQALFKKAESIDENEINNLASLSSICQFATTLILGRKLDSEFGINPLSLNGTISPNQINISENFKFIYIPDDLFEYSSENYQKTKSYYRVEKNIILPVPKKIHSIFELVITKWIKARERLTGEHHRLIEPSLVASKSEIKKLLKSLELDRRITLNYLSNYIQSVFFNVTDGDYWFSAKLSDNFKVMSGTQKHYTTIAPDIFLKLYQDGIFELFDEKVEFNEKSYPKQYKGVGNPVRPIKGYIVNELNNMGKILEKELKQAAFSFSKEDLIQHLNLLMIFFETYSSFFTGIRNVKNPYIYLQQINNSSITTIFDKDINNGYNTRKIVVLEKLIQQQIIFEARINEIISSLVSRKLCKKSDFYTDRESKEFRWRRLANKSSNFPGFFLIEPNLFNAKEQRKNINIVAYTRPLSKKFYKNSNKGKHLEFITLVSNANRHFLRSNLYEQGLNKEYIDEFLGHRQTGTESWNPTSFFDPFDYRFNIERSLKKIFKEFKVKNIFT